MRRGASDMVSYQAILEDMATALEAQDTTAYEGSTSDSWHRMRGVGPVAEDWEHLGFKIDLGLADMQGRANCLTHSGCSLEYMHRTSPDNLFLSQGRVLDSAVHATATLTAWGAPGSAYRSVPEGFQIFEADGEYVKVRISFHMYLNNWRAL